MNQLSLKDIGEEGVLQIIRDVARETGARLHPDLGVDDTALIDPAMFQGNTIWTTDTQIESTHFKFYPALEKLPLDWLGRRLFRVNLSDLSSKGATPKLAMLSVGFPPYAKAHRIEEFFFGLLSEFATHDTMLVGGDTHKTDQWSLQLTLVGEVPREQANPTRDKIRSGQSLYMTGQPGLSALGLDILRPEPSKACSSASELPQSLEKHLTPPDRSGVGRALVQGLGDSLAMMDCSDGIFPDTKRFCSAGKVGIHLNLETELLEFIRNLNPDRDLSDDDLMRAILFGGEDYELFFAANEPIGKIETLIKSTDPHCHVWKIGEAVSETGIRISRDGKVLSFDPDSAFGHFGKQS